MTASELEFHVSGPDAERLATELSDVLVDEFGTRPKRRDRPALAAETSKGDAIAMAALVLSIPGAVLATADLAKRLELKEKLDRVLSWARRSLGKDGRSRIDVVAPEGRTLRLDEAESAEVIEIAVDVNVSVRATRERR